MKKIGFVVPWFGEKIPGGAEMALRGLAVNLLERGYPVEVLTTCVKEFTADWSVNFHKPGEYEVLGIKTRRFAVRKRNTEAFDSVNYKLMNGIRVSDEEADVFLKEMVNSPDLYEYISGHKDEYSLFVYTPYMFGVTYFGIMQAPEKSVLIPCFHDEAYVYMKPYRELYSRAAGMVFLSKPEGELASRVFDLTNVKTAVLGTGIYTDMDFDPERFRKKYRLKEPFILYAGRKDYGKNVHVLLDYFSKFKARSRNDLKLVMIGGGNIAIPDSVEDDVIDLGFVDIQDKFDAYAAAELLCQPSHNESFSLVIMESWLCRRPVLVNDECLVTRNFAIESMGGLYFNGYCEFEACVNYLLDNPETADQMGINGRQYVLENFSWDVICNRYMQFFNEVVGE